MAMPKIMALKSDKNQKYLRYINEDLEAHGFLQFSSDGVVSTYTKLQVEMSKVGNRLVHIRCCYNNKYWVRSSETENWIIARADKPDEDQSKWSCTLFEPIFVDADSKKVRLRHVQLGYYACLWRVSPPRDACLYAASSDPDPNHCDIYSIIDWESLVILPKHIAFKGDNNYFLSAQTRDHYYPYLEFSASDIADETVENEVFITNDGSVRIKNHHFGKYWRRSPNWIWADSDDTTESNPDTVFKPIKLGPNIIALRNMGNNYFCKRLTTEGKTSCLNAGVPNITAEAKLEVHELVISREIYNMNFRFSEARIYGESPVEVDTVNVVNSSSEPNDITVRLLYKDSMTSSWNSTTSWKVGVEISLEVSSIPIIKEGTLTVSTSFEYSSKYTWGESIEKTKELETTYVVKVPPKTTMKVSLLATKGKCDVPYSYTQRDTLTNGNQTIYNMDDGIYTGLNSFNFHFEAVEIKT